MNPTTPDQTSKLQKLAETMRQIGDTQTATSLQQQAMQASMQNAGITVSGTISARDTITASNTLSASDWCVSTNRVTETVKIGEHEFNSKELGILLDYLSRQHKENFPECYI